MYIQQERPEVKGSTSGNVTPQKKTDVVLGFFRLSKTSGVKKAPMVHLLGGKHKYTSIQDLINENKLTLTNLFIEKLKESNFEGLNGKKYSEKKIIGLIRKTIKDNVGISPRYALQSLLYLLKEIKIFNVNQQNVLLNILERGSHLELAIKKIKELDSEKKQILKNILNFFYEFRNDTRIYSTKVISDFANILLLQNPTERATEKACAVFKYLVENYDNLFIEEESESESDESSSWTETTTSSSFILPRLDLEGLNNESGSCSLRRSRSSDDLRTSRTSTVRIKEFSSDDDTSHDEVHELSSSENEEVAVCRRYSTGDLPDNIFSLDSAEGSFSTTSESSLSLSPETQTPPQKPGMNALDTALADLVPLCRTVFADVFQMKRSVAVTSVLFLMTALMMNRGKEVYTCIQRQYSQVKPANRFFSFLEKKPPEQIGCSLEIKNITILAGSLLLECFSLYKAMKAANEFFNNNTLTPKEKKNQAIYGGLWLASGLISAEVMKRHI